MKKTTIKTRFHEEEKKTHKKGESFFLAWNGVVYLFWRSVLLTLHVFPSLNSPPF